MFKLNSIILLQQAYGKENKQVQPTQSLKLATCRPPPRPIYTRNNQESTLKGGDFTITNNNE